MLKLSPKDVCAIKKAEAKTITLAAGTAGWGVTTGEKYSSGRSRLKDDDRSGEILVYWSRFTVPVEQPFLGRVPTSEQVYNVEANVTFEVQDPSLVYRNLLQGEQSLSIAAFSEKLARDLTEALSRMARATSPDAMVDGPAAASGPEQLTRELNRVYQDYGVQVCHLCLKEVGQFLAKFDLPHLIAKIRADAQVQQVTMEEAYRRNLRELQEAAHGGNEQAKAMAQELVKVQSFDELLKVADRGVKAQEDTRAAAEQTTELLRQILAELRAGTVSEASVPSAASRASRRHRVCHCGGIL